MRPIQHPVASAYAQILTSRAVHEPLDDVLKHQGSSIIVKYLGNRQIQPRKLNEMKAVNRKMWI